jgi:NADPH:quinone reductase-like Zn-dependent oxidoreductase
VKAIRYDRYGPPDVLEVRDVDVPTPGDNQVLVRVQAASVNPVDGLFMGVRPYLARALAGALRPMVYGRGADLAGQVEAVGGNVTRLRPGDEVFGSGRGTLAEYVAVRENAVIAKPANLTFEEAAAVPIAAFTAVQALRDKGHVKPGQRVLINGASGGVGTFAVQLAKAFGAEVTGICSTGNLDLVRSLGADRVIDYTTDDFCRTGDLRLGRVAARRQTTPSQPRRYDLLVDIAGGRTLSDLRRVLAPRGVLVGVGGPDTGNWIGPLVGLARIAVLNRLVGQTLVSMLARSSWDDLVLIQRLLDSGRVRPVIDRTYKLGEVPDAIRYLEAGHARGKVVITI